MSLEDAIELALRNPIKPRGRNSISRFGAVLTDGKDTYKGWNSYRTHPLQARFGTTPESVHVHAEIAAIIAAVRAKAKASQSHYKDVTDLSGFRLYVARVLKDGSPAGSKPCLGCQSAIEAFGIEQVEWIP